MKTNREWLESLTDKQLAEFFTRGLIVTDANFEYENPYFFPMSIHQIARSYTSSILGIEKWFSMPQEYKVVEEN